LMVGIGTTASQALISANRLKQIPIIFSSVTDPVDARIVSNLKNHKERITGVSDFVPPTREFMTFKKILPGLKRLGIIYNPGEPNSVSLVKEMQKEASVQGIQLQIASANNSAAVVDATSSLIDKVDAIFINNDNTALSAFDAIVKVATNNHIPVFVSDTDMIERGALAAFGPNQYQIGREVGKIIIKVLNGENPESIHVQFPKEVELYLNLKVAKGLNILIPAEIQKEATKIFGII
jgi:putative tryptophan/tyrosine transport system substrate-binding protein